MKELFAELIIRWGPQPASQHKLTEVQYDMNNFNRAFSNAGFKILTSYWLVTALSPHYDVIDWSDYQSEKTITLPKNDFCGNNYGTDLDLAYIVYLKYIFLCLAKMVKCGTGI